MNNKTGGPNYETTGREYDAIIMYTSKLTDPPWSSGTHRDTPVLYCCAFQKKKTKIGKLINYNDYTLLFQIYDISSKAAQYNTNTR